MQAVVPWNALIDLIEPYYPKTGSKGGRSPYPLDTILRIHLMQQWYDLIDPATEDSLIEVPTIGMAMKQGTIIDATLIAAPSSTFTRA